MKNILNILFLALVLGACEQIIKIDLPPHESKIVLNAYIIAGDTLLFNSPSRPSENTITVSNSVGALSKDPINFFDDATVHISKNGTLQEVLTVGVYVGDFWGWGWSQNNSIYGYKPTQPYVPGTTINIKAAHSSLPYSAEATQKIPDYVPITAEFTTGNNPRIKVKFKDPEDQNQYMIRIFATNAIWGNFYYEYFASYDAGFDPLGWDEFFLEDGITFTEMGLLNDGKFNGKEKELELLLYYFQPDAAYYVEVTNIHPDMEKFMRSYWRYWNSADNPLAEPANIYHNVTGGYGTVCAGTRALVEVK